MNVKTAELKNNLSRYLHLINKTGETVMVYDRDRPIAVLCPLDRDQDSEWQRYRTEALARAKKIGFSIPIPAKRPSKRSLPHAEPTTAPDGNTKLNTMDLMRKGRYY